MSADKPDSSDETGSATGRDVMSSLPRTRPQRPSRRRTSSAARAKRSAPAPKSAETTRGKAGRGPSAKRPRAVQPRPRPAGRKPAGVRPSAATRAAAEPPPPKRPPQPPSGSDLVGTAIQAAGELAQIGLKLGTRALRDAAKRIPRP